MAVTFATAGQSSFFSTNIPAASAQPEITGSTNLGPMFGGFGLQTKAHLQRVYTEHGETNWGRVHFYRETSGDIPYELPVDITNAKEPTGADEDECCMVCLPSVPSYMSHPQFCLFLQDCWLDEIAHIRMVSTKQSSGRITLIEFHEKRKARDFRKEFNGKKFSTERQNDICEVVLLQAITFESTGDKTSTKSPAELPTCPVCLDRMEDSSGLVTIACQHIFHSTCLRQWSSGGCPVCRFASPLADILPTGPFGDNIDHKCSVCGTDEDLWICLLCGHVGCGRYKGGHAKEHWTETAHHFAFEIETTYIWDYADDKWAHRALRGKGNGKLVDLYGHPDPQDANADADVTSTFDINALEEKLDAIALHYSKVLATQLDSQRRHYETLLQAHAQRVSIIEAKADSLTSDFTALHEQLALETARATALENDVAREKNRADKATALARNTVKELQEEKQVTAGLMERVGHLDRKNREMEKRMAEVQGELAEANELNRDLSMTLSMQEKLEEMKVSGQLAEGEVEGASVVAGRKGKRRK